MAKRRTKKQKIRTQKYRLKKEKKVEMEPEEKSTSERKLIIKDLLKTVYVAVILLGLLVLIYWLEIRTA